MPSEKVGGHIELEKEDARAGQTGTGVRIMLVASTLLVLAGFALVALFHGG